MININHFNNSHILFFILDIFNFFVLEQVVIGIKQVLVIFLLSQGFSCCDLILAHGQ